MGLRLDIFQLGRQVYMRRQSTAVLDCGEVPLWLVVGGMLGIIIILWYISIYRRRIYKK
jgi:uncharacterized membrane protein YdcZ (DUF606 family)